MEFTRRDLGKIALASLPLARAFGEKMMDSKIHGVQVGAITYSFNTIANPDPQKIIDAYVAIGLGEAELMSNHCEGLAGAPAMPNFGRAVAGGSDGLPAWSPGGWQAPAGGPPAGRWAAWRGTRSADPGAAGRARRRHGESCTVAHIH